MTSNATLQVPRPVTIKQCVELGIYPNEGGLRSLIFYAQTNGFHKVIRKINRRVFIDVEAFYSWVNEQNKKVHPMIRTVL